jgi:cell division control protein 24
MENGSTDSLTDTLVTQSTLPKDSAQTAQNNIIREMVETERKYVQDLEIMQVCASPIPKFGIPADCEIRRNIQPRSHKQI